MVAELAKDCSTRTEFETKHRYACNIARKMGWMSKLFPTIRKRTTSLTLEQCIAITDGCITRSDLQLKNSNCLRVARKNGWLPLLGLLTPEEANKRASEKRKKYTDDYLISLAKQYTSPSKFSHDHPSEYNTAAQRGLLPTFTWFKRIDIFNTRDFIYAYEWPETHVAYIGRTIYKNTRNLAHHKKGSPVYEYAKRTGMSIPKPKYLHIATSVTDGSKLEQQEIARYKNNGWKLLNVSKGGGTGSLGIGLTKRDCIKIARGYDTIYELKKHRPSVYRKLVYKGWLKCCPWLKYKRAPSGTYSTMGEDEAYNIAKQFNCRSKFMKQYDALYRKACAEGWIDKWFPREIVVHQYSMDNKLIASYISTCQAAKALGKTTVTAIVKACNGEFAQAYGYIWKWADNRSSHAH